MLWAPRTHHHCLFRHLSHSSCHVYSASISSLPLPISCKQRCLSYWERKMRKIKRSNKLKSGRSPQMNAVYFFHESTYAQSDSWTPLWHFDRFWHLRWSGRLRTHVLWSLPYRAWPAGLTRDRTCCQRPRLVPCRRVGLAALATTPSTSGKNRDPLCHTQ